MKKSPRLSKLKKQKSLKNKTVVLGLSGSIACYKMCDTVSRLTEAGVRVYCLLTASARQFITPLTLSSLSGLPVYEDQFMEPPFSEPIHTRFGREADLIVVAPATANVMAKMATGQADDLLTSTILASTAPILIAPAMNENMWNNRFTQENVTRLKQAGMEFIDPVHGHLVCQISGMGHIADPQVITERILTLLS